MAVKLGKLLTDLLLNAGINIEADELKDKVSPLLTLDTDVDDSIASSLKTNLMTEESAKNNPVLKNYFKAQALNGMDATLQNYVDGYEGFDDTTKSAFAAEPNTFKRATLILDKLKEVESSKAGEGSSDADKKKMDDLRKQIGTLQGQIEKSATDWETKEAQIRQEAQNQVMEYAYKAELSSKPYAKKDLGDDVNITIARTLVDNQLKKDGAALKFSDGEFKLVQAADPELDFMQESKKVSFGDYANAVLTKNKIIEVSGGQKPPAQPTIVDDPNYTGDKPSMEEGISELDRQLAIED